MSKTDIEYIEAGEPRWLSREKGCVYNWYYIWDHKPRLGAHESIDCFCPSGFEKLLPHLKLKPGSCMKVQTIQVGRSQRMRK